MFAWDLVVPGLANDQGVSCGAAAWSATGYGAPAAPPAFTPMLARQTPVESGSGLADAARRPQSGVRRASALGSQASGLPPDVSIVRRAKLPLPPAA